MRLVIDSESFSTRRLNRSSALFFTGASESNVAMQVAKSPAPSTTQVAAGRQKGREGSAGNSGCSVGEVVGSGRMIRPGALEGAVLPPRIAANVALNHGILQPKSLIR